MIWGEQLANYEPSKERRGELDSLRKLLWETNVAIFVAQDGKMLSPNPATLEMYGYSKQELTSNSFTKFIHPDDQALVQGRHVARLRGEDLPSTYSFRIISAAGEIRYVELNVVPSSWEGRPATFCVQTDITERRRAEAALRQSEAYTSAIMANMVDPLITIDETCRIASMNAAAEHTFGYGADEAIGQNVSMLMPQPDRANHNDYLAKYLKSGQSKIFGKGPREIIGRHKNGSEIPLEIAIGRIDTEEGTIFVGSLRDISDRKRAENARMESEDKYRALSNLTSEGIAIIEDGIIIEANQAFAEMYGYSVSELVGKPTLELVVPEHRQEVADRLAQNLFTSNERVGLRKDGSRIPIEIKAAPIVYKGRKVRVARLRDLTETHWTAAAIRDSEERYKNITDNMPALIAYIDRDQRYRSVNKLFESWYQRPVSEIIGRRMNEIMLPESYEELKDSIDRVLAGEVVVNEDESLTPDGIHRYRKVNYLPHLGEDGTVLGFFAMVEDISDARRTTLALQREEARLAEAQRIGNIGNWERDFITGELHWSHQIYDIFGRSDMTSHGPSREGFMLLVHEEDRAFVQVALDAALESDTPFSLDHRIIRPDGVMRVVHEAAVVVRDAAGRPLRMAGTTQDITERKQAEEALRVSEQQLRLVANAMPAVIVYIDAAQRFQFVNKTAESWYERPAEEFIGCTIAEIVSEKAARLTRGRFEAAFTGETQVYEARQTYPDGKTRDVRGTYLPHFDEGGAVIGVFGLVLDMTERKRADDALRESEQRFRSVFDYAPMAIVLKNLDGRVELANRTYEEFYNIPVESILGKTSADIYSPEEAARLEENDRKVAESKNIVTEEFEATLQGALVNFVRVTKFPVFDQFGSVSGVGTFATDISAERAAQQRLIQSQKLEAVGQLTGGIAHDFNNMLAAIIGNLDMIQDYSLSEDAQRMGIAMALKAALRGAELTHRLLAFSRKQPLNAEKTQINEILPQFRQLAERTIGRDIVIEMKLAADLWPTMVDVGQLENALLNLAINARDAMPDGGRLTIETANRILEEDETVTFEDLVPGDYVMIAVTDNGTGMSAAVRKRVFEPFYTTKEVGKGSGLGLSMVLGFAKQSGGQVFIDSEEGVNTTVRIYLPRTHVTTSVESITDEINLKRPKGSETILVVEDEEDVLVYLVKILNHLGYSVLQAEHGPAALEIIMATDSIDLLLTDVILPLDMNGRDIARAFQARYPAAGVLFSSGYTREILDSRNQLDEGIELINKPYRSKDLAHRLREILDSRNQIEAALKA